MLVLNMMLIGVAVALDPLPLTAFLVILPSEGGVRKGAAFVFGWLVSLAIVVTVTVLATGNNPPKPNTAPSLASLAVKIALGAVLVVIGVRHIRARGRPKPPKKPPKWQEHVDTMSPWFAMVLAPTLQPWVLIGTGAATVVSAQLSLRLLKPAPRSETAAITLSRSRVERASRSRRVTTSTSPGSSRPITLASSGRSVLAPETFSLNTLAQPAAISSASCAARSWSRVETRA